MLRFNILLISKFLVYSLNDNFKISILTNFNLKPTTGVNFTPIDNEDEKGKHSSPKAVLRDYIGAQSLIFIIRVHMDEKSEMTSSAKTFSKLSSIVFMFCQGLRLKTRILE